MYIVSTKAPKRKLLQKKELIELEGFFMGSKNKVFKINKCSIRNIQILNKKLANPIVSKKVFTQYHKLLDVLMRLLTDDDDSGETYREALNQIEKFRLQIKNKYRDFLKKKELELMSKQLVALKKEANMRFMEIQNNYLDFQNSNHRSK